MADDDRMLQYLFTQAVLEQCTFALMAASLLDTALAQVKSAASGAAGPEANDGIWFAVHALLNAAANISKHLWPNPRRRRGDAYPNRGERLRSSLEVPEDSPLANRALRNHFEHLDERLEQWWATDTQHTIARRNVGPIHGFAVEQGFESLDPERAIVAFWRDLLELRPLMAAVAALKARAEVSVAQPWWDNADE